MHAAAEMYVKPLQLGAVLLCMLQSVLCPAVASADDSGLDLPDCITNQEEMDEAVSEWLFDLEVNPGMCATKALFSKHLCPPFLAPL